MPSTRVVVVSDSHLSPRAPEADANWAAIVRYVETSRPDVVIHLGDLSLDGACDEEDLRHARSRLDRLSAPWLAIPGNHDVGDDPLTARSSNVAVDAVRLARWRETVGPDRWSVEIDGWQLVGLNTQLFGSGLPAEAEQWDWLSGVLGDTDPRAGLALLAHKPLGATEDEIAASPAYRFVPPAARERLAGLSGRRRRRVVVSGHVHQHRCLELDGTAHWWAPTAWAVLPDDAQAPFGAKRCGVLSVGFGAGPSPAVELVEPPGLRQLMISRDLPDPYSR